MMEKKGVKFLFVVNGGSGTNTAESWTKQINEFFEKSHTSYVLYTLPEKIDIDEIKERIRVETPDYVVAVGGDGTIAMLANILVGTSIPLGILPAGSANGMAKELGIPTDSQEAMKVILDTNTRPCDVIKVNQHYCLHLSDLGLNAQLIKYFDEGKLRGKLGYAKVVMKTLVNRQKMHVVLRSGGKEIRREAFMVALANARKYGTGAVINPEGETDDGMFEVIIVKKLRFGALLRMFLKPGRFNPRNIEIFPCTEVDITTHRPMHFQVDGEYAGKETNVKGIIKSKVLNLILPAE